MPRTGRANRLPGMTTGSRAGKILALLAALTVAACSGDSTGPDGGGERPPSTFLDCNLNPDFLWAAQARDGIPSLDDPVWDRADEAVPDYLEPETRVIGVVASGQAFAVPHNVLWHHEIVNLEAGGPDGDRVAITYCPLTGSSLVFDRDAVEGTTFGISGILFMNNLVMFERNDGEESLWPQMMARAGCGPRIGDRLPQHAFVEMEWADWRELHPSTFVLAGAEAQGFDPAFFDYTTMGYPYGAYREFETFFISRIMPPLDRRRFPKERLVGAPSTDVDPGIAFPFGALEGMDGVRQVVEFMYEGRAAVVLWSDEARGGAAYRPITESGEPATLRATDSGFEDEETGSFWSLEGRAVSGPREGARLVPVEQGHTAFWGAWAAFHPDTRLWEG